jgi:hypothetical protein
LNKIPESEFENVIDDISEISFQKNAMMFKTVSVKTKIVNDFSDDDLDSISLTNTSPKKYTECPPDYLSNPSETPFDMEKVVDWPDRIKDYRPEIQELYQTTFSKRLEMLAILSSPFKCNGWRETGRNNKHGFVVEERTSVRGNPSIRVSCDYDYDALTVLRAYCDPINRKLYDSNVEDVFFKRQFGVGLFGLY